MLFEQRELNEVREQGYIHWGKKYPDRMQLTYKGPEKRTQVAMIGKEAALPNT